MVDVDIVVVVDGIPVGFEDIDVGRDGAEGAGVEVVGLGNDATKE